MPGAMMLSIVNGFGGCLWCEDRDSDGGCCCCCCGVGGSGGGGGGGGAGGGDSDCSLAAATVVGDRRRNVASRSSRSAAGSLNRLRRRRNEPFSNMSSAAGCRAQYAPFPGLSGRRGIFTKQSLNDRLCRNEFCHLKHIRIIFVTILSVTVFTYCTD